MFNLRINKDEYETLIDMCSLALMVAHNAGACGEHEMRMNAMFNELLKMSHDRKNVISDERIDMLQETYLFRSNVNFYKHMTEDIQIAVEVKSVAENK